MRFDAVINLFGSLYLHPIVDYFPKLKPLEPVRARAVELELLDIRLLLAELTAVLW